MDQMDQPKHPESTPQIELKRNESAAQKHGQPSCDPNDLIIVRRCACFLFEATQSAVHITNRHTKYKRIPFCRSKGDGLVTPVGVHLRQTDTRQPSGGGGGVFIPY